MMAVTEAEREMQFWLLTFFGERFAVDIIIQILSFLEENEVSP